MKPLSRLFTFYSSAYIKSIDSNHLVSLGDEGFYNNDKNSYVYSGADGIDFDQNLQVSTLDFGTYHLYPVGWGYSDASGMGSKWITDHAASATKYGKPVILEVTSHIVNQAIE